MRNVFAMAIAASAACSCSYRGSFVDCEVACTLSTGCPPGFKCSASNPEEVGLCRSGATMPSCAAILDGGVDGGVDGGSTACPAVFGSGRHLFVNMVVPWEEARAYCTSLDSTPAEVPYVHLIVISDTGELAQMVPPALDVWVGYSDRKLNPAAPNAAQFLWVTSESGVAMWGGNEPDDVDGPRCAHRDNGDGLLHDRTCATGMRAFVCECDQFPENPNNI